MNEPQPSPGQVLEIHVCEGESNIIGVRPVTGFLTDWDDLLFDDDLFDDDEQRPTIDCRVAWRGIVHETGAYLTPIGDRSAVDE